VQIAYLLEVLCPQIRDISVSTSNLSTSQRASIVQERGKKGLRALAKEHDVSYEAVRRVLNIMGNKASNKPLFLLLFASSSFATKFYWVEGTLKKMR